MPTRAGKTAPSANEEAVLLEIEEYRRLREYEREYWWHVGRRFLLSAMLRSGVSEDRERPGLDIGCGTGANATVLEPYGRFVGSDVSAELYRAGLPRPVHPVLLAGGETLPFADTTFGLCTFFDVLEHIDDENSFLREVRRVLRPGAFVLLSVPAYPFLWSEHDVSLHHRRRYVRRTLRDALTRNGFEVVRLSHGMASVFPLIAGYRLLARLAPRRREPQASYVRTPALLNRLLSVLLEIESLWLRRADLPFGTSLLCLARKGMGSFS